MSREFVRIKTESVFFLDTPEQVEIARGTLRKSGASAVTIWTTPSDERDPDVSTTGQRLLRDEPPAESPKPEVSDSQEPVSDAAKQPEEAPDQSKPSE